MKSAEAFVKAIERGLSPIKAVNSIPNHDPLYIDKIPAEIYQAALQYGWRFLPVWSGKQLTAKHGHFFEATANLLQLRGWARERPTGWILVTGQMSGVVALEVDGIEGLTSLLRICRDDWSWLDTRRAFESADTVAPSRPFPPCNSVSDPWSNVLAEEAAHD